MAITLPKRKDRVVEGKPSELGKVLQVVGGIAGGVLGGMASGGAGAVGGATGGASLGATLGGMVDPAKADVVEQRQQIAGVQTPDSSMSRRLAASREDRLAVLRQAEAALPQLPPELRQEYAGTIVRATMEEEKRRAMGMGG